MSTVSLETFAHQIKIYLYTPIPICVNKIWLCYCLHLLTCQPSVNRRIDRNLPILEHFPSNIWNNILDYSYTLLVFITSVRCITPKTMTFVSL